MNASSCIGIPVKSRTSSWAWEGGSKTDSEWGHAMGDCL